MPLKYIPTADYTVVKLDENYLSDMSMGLKPNYIKAEVLSSNIFSEGELLGVNNIQIMPIETERNIYLIHNKGILFRIQEGAE